MAAKMIILEQHPEPMKQDMQEQPGLPDKARLDSILKLIPEKFKTGVDSLEIDGQALQILGIENMPRHLEKLAAARAIRDPLTDLPLWAKVWPASFVLGRFLRKFDTAGKTMLELGAGMGVCSLIASRWGFAKILATDVNPDAINFARANAMLNGLEDRIAATQLDVRRPPAGLEEKFDFICASEILYLERLHSPLLRFITRHLATGGKAIFCVDYKRLQLGFAKLAKRHFAITQGNIGVKSRSEEDGENKAIYSILILERS